MWGVCKSIDMNHEDSSVSWASSQPLRQFHWKVPASMGTHGYTMLILIHITYIYACLYTNTTQSSSVCILVFILQLASMHFNAFHIIHCGTWKDLHLCPTFKQCFYRSKFEAERVQRAGPSAWAGLPRSLPLYKLLGVAYIHCMDLHGLPLSCIATAFVKAMCTCQFTHCILLLSQLPCLGHKQHLGLCARTIAELLQTKKTSGFTGVHQV